MRFIKPLDETLLDTIASRFDAVVTLEDNVITGGFGSGVTEFYASRGSTNLHVKIHGIPDRFIEHGSPDELYGQLQLDPRGIAGVVKAHLSTRPPAHRRTIEAIVQ
jgi:1-deoxy-D-xylulose-5-phosphate synthase